MNSSCITAIARSRIAASTRTAWPAACPDWPRLEGPRSSPRWATRPGSPNPNSSVRSPGSLPKLPRPVTPTAKAGRCRKPDRRCYAPRSCAPSDTARKQDPQLARIYYVQMVERGKNHIGALCVVAAQLAERAWIVMNRQTPCVICDTDNTPITAEHAAAIIADRWTVPTEVRARRRSKKGKAPQAVSTRRHERGDLPQPASSTRHHEPVNPRQRTQRQTA
jgi:hypothetical protein